MRRLGAVVGLWIAGLALIMAGPASAGQSLPTAVFGVGAQVTPSAGWTYYQTLDLTSSVRPGGAEPDVVRLAGALANDPDQIYAFVHDQITVLPLFGLKAGFRGAIIDKAGTPFDQAQLMVELLRASGVTASYQLGTIQLTASEMGDWLGVSNTTAIPQLLSNGGFPWTTVTVGGVTKYELMHVWVRAVIGGTTYVFDPSYKSHAVKAGIANLDSAMGFNAATFLSRAASGAVTATDNGTCRVRGMNRANIQSDLQTASTTLLSYLRANLPDAFLEDIIGGRSIVALTGGPVRQTSLARQGTLYTTFANDLPPALRTKVTLSFAYNAGTQSMAFSWYADEIYGEPLSFRMIDTKNAADPESFRVLRGDTPITGWLTGIVPNPTVTVDHPYAGSGGHYMDRAVSATGNSFGTLQILLGFGRPSEDLGSWQEPRNSTSEGQITRRFVDAQEILTPVGVQTATKRRIAASYLAQASAALDMVGAIGAAQVQAHDFIGVVTTSEYYGARRARPAATSFSMSVEAGLSTTANDGSAGPAQAAARTSALMLSALEGSLAEQIGDSAYAGSTPAKFDWAIDGNATTDNRWFYLATPANWTWVRSQILTDMDGGSPMRDVADQYVAGGYSLVITRSSDLGPGPATLKYCAQITPSCDIHGPDRGGAFVALKGDGSGMAHIVAKQYGFAKGGGGTDDAEVQPGRVFAVPEDFRQRQYTSRAEAASVDLKSGIVSYAAPPDLVVGNGGYPYSLAFQRSFRSGSLKADMAYVFNGDEAPKPDDPLFGDTGWTSNLRHKIVPGSDGFVRFGRMTPQAAVQTIVAIRAMLAASGDGAGPMDQLENQITSNLAASWWTKTIPLDTLTVLQGHESRSFTQLADGSWAPPPGRDESIVVTGTRQLRVPLTGPAWWSYNQMCVKLTGADRSVSYYGIWDSSYTTCTPPAPDAGPAGRQLQRVLEFHHQVFKFGVVVDQDDTGIWNNLGRRIDVTGATITDHEAPTRQVSFTTELVQVPTDSSIAYGKLTVTDAESHVWVFAETAPNNLRPAGFEIYAPSNTTRPFVRFNYGPDARGQVDSMVDAKGNVSLYRIGAGRVGASVDPYGQASRSFFDIYGQPVLLVDRLGRRTLTTYDAHRRPGSVTRPEGNQDVYAYDTRSNLLSTTRHAKPGSGLADIVTSATYHAVFNVPLTETDARGYVTSHNYDAATGLLLTTTQPSVAGGAPVWTLTWNSLGQRLTKTDPTGIVTRYGYDSSSHYLTSVVAADGTLNLTTTFGYDAAGDIVSLTDPRGKLHTATWDRLRRITGWTAPSSTGAQTQWVYDVDGLLSQVKQATGVVGDPWAITAYAYEPTAQVAAVTDADGRVTRFTYDKLNRLVLTLDPKGGTMGAVYDVEGQLLQTRRGDGSGLAQAYDTRTYTANGKLATQMDAGGGTTAYSYDGFDRLVRADYPNAATGAPNTADYETLAYDPAGNVTAKRLRGGATIGFTSYDGLNRLITKAVPAFGAGSADTMTYGYDLAGRQTSVTDTLGHSLTDHYDQAGRLDYVDTAGPQWSGTKRVSYQYDAASNRTRLTWPDGWYVAYGYDDLNRLASASDSGGALLASYGYNPLSQRTGVTLPGSAGSETAVFSKAGDLTGLTQAWASGGGVTTTYGYDTAHRATSAAWSDAAYQWTPGSAATTAYSPDKLNRYAAVAGTGFSYDGNQNLTGDGTWTFGYDAENRLLTAAKTGTSASYSYDPLGRRAGKAVTIGGTTTTTAFLHDGDEEIADYDGAGALLKRYVPSNATDRPIVQVDGAGAKLWFRTDRQGTVIAMTDASGVRQEGAYSYDPYGRPNVTTGTAFRYTGRRYDPETGLYYYRARYYSPGLGRFLQTDPIGYEGGANLYAYVGDDPINMADPTGLARCGTSVKGVDCINAQAANKIIIRRGQAALAGARAWVASQAPGAKMTPGARYFAQKWERGTKVPLTLKSAGVFIRAVSVQINIAANEYNIIENGKSDGWPAEHNGGSTSLDGREAWIGPANFTGEDAVEKLTFTLGHEYLHGIDYSRRPLAGSGVGDYSPLKTDDILSIEGIPYVK